MQLLDGGADHPEGPQEQETAQTRWGRRLTPFAVALASGVVRAVVAVSALLAGVLCLAVAGFCISLPFGFGALALGFAVIAAFFGFGE